MAAPLAAQQTAVIVGDEVTEDATIYESGTLTNNVENENAGADDGILAGRTGNRGGAAIRRALVRFDLSQIPPGSVIESASLVLTVRVWPTGADPAPASLHRVSASWVEGNGTSPQGSGIGGTVVEGAVTWNSREHPDVAWTTPGGDFEQTPSATGTSGNIFETPLTFDGAGVTADVQAWIDGTEDNNGWIILGDESQPMTARKYDSSNGAPLPPALTVTYTPPPAFEGWMLF